MLFVTNLTKIATLLLLLTDESAEMSNVTQSSLPADGMSLETSVKLPNSALEQFQLQQSHCGNEGRHLEEDYL